jgi:hypothetical protein
MLLLKLVMTVALSVASAACCIWVVVAFITAFVPFNNVVMEKAYISR